MALSAPDTILLVIAGVAAGLVGSAGGITSSVSYPVLLAVGLPAVAANIANNIALVACWPGSAHASQPELKGRREWLGRWTPLAICGGAAGAGLLLVTPNGVFEQIVPFLIAAGSLALALEPRMTAWRRRREAGQSTLALGVGLLIVCVYGGYFGAGSGVMALTLILVFVDQRLVAANALKNMIIGATQLACTLVFVFGGPVNWSATVPLGLGMLLGANLGPRVVRRIPTRVLRWLIVAVGFALAVRLWINPTL